MNNKYTKIIFSFFASIFALFQVKPALAAWTPLIASTDFDGIKADLLVCVGGILALVIIIAGIGVLIRVLPGR